MPAIDAVVMTRDGSSWVAFFRRSGANLSAHQQHTLQQYKIGIHILLYTNKNTLHIQSHHLCKRILRMLVKRRSPRCPSIREQDVDMISVLLHLLHQSRHLPILQEISGHGDGLAGAGQGIESRAGFFAGFGFAGGDEDF